MGQYHKTFNLDKQEFINPHALGDGLKLLEQTGWSPGGTNDALHLLIAACSGRGGGDFQSEPWDVATNPDGLVGRWAGDRIAVIGDYAEPHDIPGCDASLIYAQSGETGGFRDITDLLIPTMEREYECIYCGDGWVKRISLFKIPGLESTHGHGERMARISGKDYPISSVRARLREHIGRGLKVESFVMAAAKAVPA